MRVRLDAHSDLIIRVIWGYRPSCEISWTDLHDLLEHPRLKCAYEKCVVTEFANARFCKHMPVSSSLLLTYVELSSIG
jgi:hypothetical protein